MKTILPDGIDVLFNGGDGPDIPGVVEHQTPPNPALKQCIHVRFARCAAWLDPAWVRVMHLTEHRRICGKRFCDWQYVLWNTLIYHFARGFETLEREQLAAWWQSGISEAAAARHLAAAHDWVCLNPQAHRSAPAYARPFIADLGYHAHPETAHVA